MISFIDVSDPQSYDEPTIDILAEITDNKTFQLYQYTYTDVILSYLLSVVPLVAYLAYVSTTLQFRTTVLFIIAFIFPIFMYYHSLKFATEDRFKYPNTPNDDDWILAATFAYQSIKKSETDSITAYYWAKKSIDKHKSAAETSQRPSLQKASNEMIAILEMIISTDDKTRKILFMQEHLEKANDYFSKRVCDECKTEKSISDTYIKNMNKTQYVICEDCHTASKKWEQDQHQYKEQQNTQQQYKERQYNNQQKRTNNKNYNNNSSNQEREYYQWKRNNQQQRQKNIQNAMEILDITTDLAELTIKDVDSKFKEKVHDVHPDKEHGSTEEFKNVKKARKTLIDQLED